MKKVLLYVTGNLVLGGGDQILLAHARALAATPYRIVLFSLEPVIAEESLVGELQALGVEVRALLPLSWISMLTALLVPAVVAARAARAVLGMARPHRRPAGSLLSEAKACFRQPRLQAERELCRRLLRARVQRFVRQHPVAGLHIFHAAACQALGTLAYSLGTTSYYTEILMPKSYAAWAPELAAILPQITEIIVPAKTVEREMRDTFQLTQPFHVIPFVVDLPEAPQTPDFQASRTQYGVIARLSEEKGHRYLLEAMPEIQRRCRQARLILAGEGRMRRQLEQRITDLGCTALVRFLGAFRPQDLPHVMAEIDVVVLPSLVEGMPHVLVEAMAFGKPIVATPVGAVAEMVTDGVNGFLVPVGDSAALADRVSQILLDPDLRLCMGQCSREFYRERYDYETVLQKIRALYER